VLLKKYEQGGERVNDASDEILWGQNSELKLNRKSISAKIKSCLSWQRKNYIIKRKRECLLILDSRF
jgi:hypothetical protein